MRVPLGVIGIIYESRPNVTVDAAGLCIKRGNATILRGGSEAIHCNRALAERIRAGLAQARAARTTPCNWSRRPTARPSAHLIADAAVRRRHHPARRQGADRAADRARPRCR